MAKSWFEICEGEWDQMISSVAKFKRETKRIMRNFAELPSAFFDHFLSTRYYDLLLAKQVQTIHGVLSLGEKVAIFLIFPQGGLTVGHVQSLNYFSSEGYSPIVVSNLPLREEDVEILRPLCHKIILRPNFGYDFGGYRDGIRLVGKYKEKIAHLALFNDSVWFPLPNSKKWLNAAERMQVDFAGALSHAGPDWREAIQFFHGADAAKRKYSALFHYCSFALLFSGRSLKSDEFWKFWDRLRLSSSKRRTVRNGERGLSKFMFRAGFSRGSTITNEDIAYRLRQIPPCCRSYEVSLFEEQGGWPAYSLSEFLWREYRFMFLKKKDVDGNHKSIDDLKPVLESLRRLAVHSEQISEENKLSHVAV